MHPFGESMLTPALDPASDVPLVRQIVDALLQRIERGELSAGQRLLSVRALA